MITFNKPQNVNGTQLRDELNAAGVTISYDEFSVEIDNNVLLLNILESDKEKAVSIVAAHNGTTVAPEPTIAEKLASVGLSVDDLKTALGLS
jgi:poly-gamma-glutamate capsule biosynthesis protein CapA/YwtB (metallophosphatase superfamily)